jgi:hypothetical protein
MCLIVIGSILAALGIYGAIGYQEYKNNKEYNHVYIPLVEMNNEKVKHIEFLPNNYIMVVMDNNRTYDRYINEKKEIDNILLKSMNDRSKLIDEFKKEIDSDEDDNKKIN